MSGKKNTCQKSAKGGVKAKLEAAIKAITAMMEKSGLNLSDVQYAVATLIYQALKTVIMNMRSKGKSIRAIARTVHMDDSRVSAIIKENQAGASCKKAKKACKKVCKKPCKAVCKAKKR